MATWRRHRDQGGSGLAGDAQRGQPPLWERRLCFVMGKGGVGKSTVAAALSSAYAREGKRSLLVEVLGRNRLSRLLEDRGVGTDPVDVGGGLHAIAIDPQAATEEYLRGQLRVRALAEVLVHSKAFRGFTAAAPGLAEMVTIGKIWQLAVELRPEGDAPVWDRIVVDCPATGHGIALLETAGNVREIARSGPVHDQADRIEQVISHPAATGVALVARPDELPVGEALDAVERLDELGVPVAAAVLNATTPQRFSVQDDQALRAALADGMPVAGRTAAAAALDERVRAGREREQCARLVAAGLPVIELPRLTGARVDDEGVAELAEALAVRFRAPEAEAVSG